MRRINGMSRSRAMLGALIRRITLVIICLVYTILLSWSYIYIISPAYSYMGFTYQRPSLYLLLAAFLLALLPSIWMPIALVRPSQVAYWLLYLVVVIPASIIPVFILAPGTVNPLFYTLTLVICFGLLGGVYALPLLPLERLPNPLALSKKQFTWLFGLLTVFLILHVLSVFGLNFRFVSLLSVYTVRLDFTAQIAGQFVGYSVNWLALVISPILIAYGLVQGRYFISAIGVLISIMIYGLAAYKSVLFSSLLIIAVFAVTGERYRKTFGLWAILASSFFVGIVSLIGLLYDWRGLSFFLVGRILAMPGVLTAYFFEFFSLHEKALLGYSILRSFVDYPYQLVPSYLIGQVYFYDPPPQANVHLWGDAFANFGYWGMVGFTLLAALIMWLFDSLARIHNSRFLSSILAVHAFTLANTALLTAILSQGIGLTLAILFLMPQTRMSDRRPQHSRFHQNIPHHNHAKHAELVRETPKTQPLGASNSQMGTPVSALGGSE